VSFPYVIDASIRLATISIVGRVEARDVAETIAAIYEDPEWRAGFNMLWDACDVTDLQMTRSDLPVFVALHREHVAVAPQLEVILVRRDVDRTLAEMYGLLMRSAVHAVYVVSSEDEARQCLTDRS
jgi:hypothetical protein